MTFNDLEHQNRGFCGFFGNFGLQDSFQERIAPKSLETEKDKLHMNFSIIEHTFQWFKWFKETSA